MNCARFREVELEKLLEKAHKIEMHQSSCQLEIASALGRNEALKETANALRERASTKFTMGRSERLNLQREADIIFRMTTASPPSPFADHVDLWRAERDQRRQALKIGVNLLFEMTSALVQTS